MRGAPELEDGETGGARVVAGEAARVVEERVDRVWVLQRGREVDLRDGQAPVEVDVWFARAVGLSETDGGAVAGGPVSVGRWWSARREWQWWWW